MKKIIIVLAIVLSMPLLARDVKDIEGKYYSEYNTTKEAEGYTSKLYVLELKKDSLTWLYPDYQKNKCSIEWNEKESVFYLSLNKDKDKPKTWKILIVNEEEGKLVSSLKFEYNEKESEILLRVSGIQDAQNRFNSRNYDVKFGHGPDDPESIVAGYINTRAWWPSFQINKVYPVVKDPLSGYRIRAEFTPVGKYLNKLPKKCYDFYYKNYIIYDFKQIY